MRWTGCLSILVLLLTQPCLAQNEDPVAQSLAADYRRRLAWFVQADLDWLKEAAGLSEQQQGDVRQLADRRLEQEIQGFIAIFPDSLPKTGFADGNLHPGVFALESSAASSMLSKLNSECWGQFLSPSQQAAYTTAREERIRFRRDAFTAYAVAILELEVRLSPEQRQALIAGWRRQTVKLDHGYFTCSTRESFLPRQPLLQFVQSISEIILRGDQLQAVIHAADPLVAQRFDFNEAVDLETRMAEFNPPFQALRNLALEYGEDRIAYYTAAAKLGPEQVAMLRLAVRGVAAQMADDWLDRVRLEVKSTLANRRGLPGMPPYKWSAAPSVIGSRQFDEHPLWIASLQQACGDSLLPLEADRANRIHSAVATAVVAMLDQELWLTARQRDQLLPLVQTCLPDRILPNENAHVPRALVDLLSPLLKLPQGSLTQVLTATQLGAWEEMKSRLQIVNAGGQTVLRLVGKDHGQASRRDVVLDDELISSVEVGK